MVELADSVLFDRSKAQRAMRERSALSANTTTMPSTGRPNLHDYQRYRYCGELWSESRLQSLECISHSPAYLPKQARNTVTPSRLLFNSPEHQCARGFFYSARTRSRNSSSFARASSSPCRFVAENACTVPRSDNSLRTSRTDVATCPRFNLSALVNNT